MTNYAVDFNYLIEDHDLNGDWHLTQGTLWRPPVSTKRTSIELPGMHGIVAAGKLVYEPPLLTFKHTVQAPTAQLAEDSHNALIGLLTTKNTSNSDHVKITRIAGGYETVAYGRLVAISSPEEFVPQGWIISFSSEFEISSVFFRDVDYVDIWDSNFTSAASQTIYWAGGDDMTAPITDAVFRFTGPLTQITVTDPVSGTGFTVSRSVPTGQYLYVDTGNWDAWVSTSNNAWTVTGTIVSGALDSNIRGMLEITPKVGSSAFARTVALKYDIVGQVVGTTKVAIQAKRAFL